MTEMVTSGSMSGGEKRSDGLLGESGHERRRSQSGAAGPVRHRARPRLYQFSWLDLVSRARRRISVKPNVVVLGSSSGVAPAERREAERSGADRSGAGATPDARGAVSPARPDPEVVIDAKRRTFTAEYKQRVSAAAEHHGRPRRHWRLAPPGGPVLVRTW